jgi:glucose/arabinose dehydrogenase
MVDKHTRFLWIIAGVLAAVFIALLGWAVVRPGKANAPTTTANKTATHHTVTYKPPVITPVSFAKGLNAPTNIIADGVSGDTRLFVTERGGTIRIVNKDGTVSAPILDISSKVLAGGEMGLIGLAFHPKFAENHYLYIYYINHDRQSVLARYKFDTASNTINPTTEKVLLTIPQPYENHNGGQLAFGVDGYLYWGLGDGGSGGDPENRAQDVHTLLGKILRLDVDGGNPYSIPATNPFTRSTDRQVKPEIWAYGLRNPWRFSFDSKTHDLYIADVGQGTYEEIDVQPAASKGGENYGWRCREGLHDFNTAGCKDASQYVSPVIEYTHEGGRCSITGGYIYRGTAEPALDGLYIFGDYCTGEIMYASKQDNTWSTTGAAKTGSHISTFGQGNDGELYYADLDKGELFHITDTAN